MDTLQKSRLARTDMWREGKWLDLWSVVHLLSGILVGLFLYFVHLGNFASVLIALLSLTLYELWEMIVRIQEAPTNRFMDIVVGMTGFLPAFFLFAPPLSRSLLVLVFGSVLIVNVAMSIVGWRASQKAAEFEKRIRVRFARQRARLSGHRTRLRERFRRRKKGADEHTVI